MRITREMSAKILRVVIAVAAVSLTLAASATIARASKGSSASPTVATTSTPAPPAPVARDTRGNLQDAFQNEVNTKARYVAAAAIADREGYPQVARLFRACAQSEQIHADQDVHAIAWMGDEAKAYLERQSLGTTAENLRAAIDRETYESTQLYPALVARARAEHLPAAVRSLTFALATERVHAQRLTSALAQLEQRPAPKPVYVCGLCGMMTDSLEFNACPSCFTSARRFVRVD